MTPGSPAGEATARERTPPHRSRSMPHLPALDGLRGIAVAAVVVYHVSPDLLPGGFLGVDVFFVLSGFLITSLLVLEVEATARVRLVAFYARRLRRLAPALLLVIAALVVYAAVLATPGEVARIRSHGIASLLWFANWRLVVDGTTYTDLVAGASPLRHMWSLAIEEQFYVIFPLVVVGVARWWRGSLRTALVVVAGIGVAASAVWMSVVHETTASIERAYFGTDTRAHGLLVGVVLGAVLVGRPPELGRIARVAGVVALPAAAFVAAVMVTTPEVAGWLYRGGFLLVSIAVAAVIAGIVRARWLGRALSWRPLVRLGLISYGVYLWHWPVIVLVDRERIGLDGAALAAAQIGLTLVAALLSYHLVEQPIRNGALRRHLGSWSLATGPLAIGAAVALMVVVIPSPVSSPDPVTVSPIDTATPTPEVLSLVIAGDSVAHTLAGGTVGDFPSFVPWTPEQSPFNPAQAVAWSVARPGCSFLPGRVAATTPEGRLDSADLSSFCGDWPTDLEAAVSIRRADVVLLALANDTRDRVIDGRLVLAGSPEWELMVHELLGEVTAIASRNGAQVGLVVLPPRTGRFAEGLTTGGGGEAAMASTLSAYARGRPDDAAFIVDLASAVCPGGTCDAPTAGFRSEWRYDGMHYTADGSAWFAAWVLAELPA